MLATDCAEERGEVVFLCDRQWSPVQRAGVAALQSQRPKSSVAGDSPITDGWLCIPTGGTGGGVKFARHDERTLSAAARGFCAHFGLDRVNAVNVLPAYHVGGLMPRIRCAATQGEHVAWDWKRLEAGDRPTLAKDRGAWVISLVPTQLQRLIAVPEALGWLRGFQLIFLGGGPLWPALAKEAARTQLPLALSYGMTETAAMVTALQPQEFLAGGRSSGAAMPHARVRVDAEGVVHVAGESVFHGYWPETRIEREFTTEDLGVLDELGHLHIRGRRDAVIITGGMKVRPTDVEAALRASGEFADVAVLGVPDPAWGEAVVACFPAGGPLPDFARAVQTLAPYQKPKRFVAMPVWPRNAQGKINRAALLAAASARPNPVG